MPRGGYAARMARIVVATLVVGCLLAAALPSGCGSDQVLTSVSNSQASGSGGAAGAGGDASPSSSSAGGGGPCQNALCGTPCTAEAGPGLCDGQGSCVILPVDCGSCDGKACGDTCMICDPTDTQCTTVVCDDQGLCDRAEDVTCI
jgi:hypothetical protein